MASQDISFSGSIPFHYDRGLGPVLFEPTAVELGRRLPELEGGRVLEVACGTGRVTRLIRARYGASVEVVATDLSASMLAYAQAHGPDGVQWMVADALSLPFEDESFDLLVCQFALMFFPDKEAGLREFRRVLKPGGKAIVAVWDAISRIPAALKNYELVKRAFPQDPPQFLEVPYAMCDPEVTKRLFESAFDRVEIERFEAEISIEEPEEVAQGFILGNPVANQIIERDPDAPERLVAELAKEFAGDPVTTACCWFVLAS